MGNPTKPGRYAQTSRGVDAQAPPNQGGMPKPAGASTRRPNQTRAVCPNQTGAPTRRPNRTSA
eukprot:3667526-Prymnesium_polylepis.1